MPVHVLILGALSVLALLGVVGLYRKVRALAMVIDANRDDRVDADNKLDAAAKALAAKIDGQTQVPDLTAVTDGLRQDVDAQDSTLQNHAEVLAAHSNRLESLESPPGGLPRTTGL